MKGENIQNWRNFKRKPTRSEVLDTLSLMACKNENLIHLIDRLKLYSGGRPKDNHYLDSNELVIELKNSTRKDKLKTKLKNVMRNRKQSKSKTATKSIYAKGVALFNPHENAPDFVIGRIIISIDDFLEFIEGEGEQYLKNSDKYGDQLVLDIKENDEGDLYATIDTYNSASKKSKNDEEEEENDEEEEAPSKSKRTSKRK